MATIQMVGIMRPSGKCDLRLLGCCRGLGIRRSRRGQGRRTWSNRACGVRRPVRNAFRQFERPRRDKIALRPKQVTMTDCRDCARGHRKFAAQVERIGNPPHMPKLQQDAAAGIVDGARDELPAFDVLGGLDTGSVSVADAHRRNAVDSGKHQPRAGPLAIVFGHHSIRHTSGARASPRERGQHNTVWQVPGADGQGIE